MDPRDASLDTNPDRVLYAFLHPSSRKSYIQQQKGCLTPNHYGRGNQPSTRTAGATLLLVDIASSTPAASGHTCLYLVGAMTP